MKTYYECIPCFINQILRALNSIDAIHHEPILREVLHLLGDIDFALNTTCAKCVKYCSIMEVPCQPPNIIFNYKQCNSCGLCLKMCPEKAIYWFKEMEEITQKSHL
ncbi:MAG: hypothetical protein GY718_06240 [Lentisphaerae bacterium]|nr:hypothetical protein [Lentisphaerota bacterium]